MSITRAELRYLIGLTARQPFFERFASGFLTATGGTTTTLVDTANLKQDDDFWNGQFLYLPTRNISRIISDFTSTTSTLVFREPVQTITSGTRYEIWAHFSPADVHNAINLTLHDAWPFFYDDQTDFFVIVPESGRVLTLPFSAVPRFVYEIAVENPADSVTGQVTQQSGNSTYLIDSSRTFTTEDIGKEIRIFAGEGAGDRRIIAAIINTTTVQVNSAWTNTPNTSSKYLMTNAKNATYERLHNWEARPLNAVTTIFLKHSMEQWAGRLLRVSYESEFTSLQSDTDITNCPQEFVIMGALARLYLSRLGSAPYSEDVTWVNMQRVYAEAANTYAMKYRYVHHNGVLE